MKSHKAPKTNKYNNIMLSFRGRRSQWF